MSERSSHILFDALLSLVIAVAISIAAWWQIEMTRSWWIFAVFAMAFLLVHGFVMRLRRRYRQAYGGGDR